MSGPFDNSNTVNGTLTGRGVLFGPNDRISFNPASGEDLGGRAFDPEVGNDYQAGDIVTYLNVLYENRTGEASSATPDTDTTNWRIVSTGTGGGFDIAAVTSTIDNANNINIVPRTIDAESDTFEPGGGNSNVNPNAVILRQYHDNDLIRNRAEITDQINTGLAGKQDTLVVGDNLDAAPTAGSNNPVTSGGVHTALANAGEEVDLFDNQLDQKVGLWTYTTLTTPGQGQFTINSSNIMSITVEDGRGIDQHYALQDRISAAGRNPATGTTFNVFSVEGALITSAAIVDVDDVPNVTSYLNVELTNAINTSLLTSGTQYIVTFDDRPSRYTPADMDWHTDKSYIRGQVAVEQDSLRLYQARGGLTSAINGSTPSMNTTAPVPGDIGNGYEVTITDAEGTTIIGTTTSVGASATARLFSFASLNGDRSTLVSGRIYTVAASASGLAPEVIGAWQYQTGTIGNFQFSLVAGSGSSFNMVISNTGLAIWREVSPQVDLTPLQDQVNRIGARPQFHITDEDTPSVSVTGQVSGLEGSMTITGFNTTAVQWESFFNNALPTTAVTNGQIAALTGDQTLSRTTGREVTIQHEGASVTVPAGSSYSINAVNHLTISNSSVDFRPLNGNFVSRIYSTRSANFSIFNQLAITGRRTFTTDAQGHHIMNIPDARGITLDNTARTVETGVNVVNDGEAYIYIGADTITLVDSDSSVAGATTFDPDLMVANARVFLHLTDTGRDVYQAHEVTALTVGYNSNTGFAENPVFFAPAGQPEYVETLVVSLNGSVLARGTAADQYETAEIGGVTGIRINGNFALGECFVIRGVVDETAAPEPDPVPTPAVPAESQATQDFHNSLELVRDVRTSSSIAWIDTSPFPYRFHIDREYASYWDETSFVGTTVPNYFGDRTATSTIGNANLNRFGTSTAFPNHRAFTGSNLNVSGITRIDNASTLTFPIIAFDFDYRTLPTGNFDHPIFSAGPLQLRWNNAGVFFTAPDTSATSSTHQERVYLSYERGGTTAYDNVGNNIRTGRTDTGIPLRYILPQNTLFTDTNNSPSITGTGQSAEATFQIQINISANGVPYPTTDPSNPANATGNHFQNVTLSRANYESTARISLGTFTISGYAGTGAVTDWTPTFEMFVETRNSQRMITIEHRNGPRVGLEVTYADKISYLRNVTTVVPSHANRTYLPGTNRSRDEFGYTEVLMVFSQDGAGIINVQTIMNGQYQSPVSLGFSAQEPSLLNGFEDPVFNPNSIFNIGHVQIYSYVHHDDWQHYEVTQMYNNKENWLGAFGNPSFNTARYVTNRLVDMRGTIVNGNQEVELLAEIVPNALGTDYEWRFTPVADPTITSISPLSSGIITQIQVSFAPTSFRPNIDPGDYSIGLTNAADPTRDITIAVLSVGIDSTDRNVINLTVGSTPITAGDVITVDYQQIVNSSVTVT